MSRLGDRVHLDKNPTHTLFLPAIIRLFPETKFLVALRDPDVVVSCYMQFLPLNPTTTAFLTWDSTARRYALDLGMWLRFRPLLDPETWLEVRYEDVVEDMPASAKRALAFLNLPWEDSVLLYRVSLAEKTVHSPPTWMWPSLYTGAQWAAGKITPNGSNPPFPCSNAS